MRDTTAEHRYGRHGHPGPDQEAAHTRARHPVEDRARGGQMRSRVGQQRPDTQGSHR